MSKDPNVIEPRSNGYIDPLEMARFLVLPGAVDLLKAFARIPPGALRQSVIDHAHVIADTYSGAPADQQMPDPLLTASRTSPLALPPKAEPTHHKRKPQDQEEAIIAARLEGLNKHQIIARTGAHRQAVEATLKTATKAGVKFPPMAVCDPPTKRFITVLADLSPQGRSNMELAAVRYGHSVESWIAARATLVSMRRAMKPRSR